MMFGKALEKAEIHRLRRTVFTCAAILLGNALMAFSVAAFIIPRDIIMGGATGIGIILAGFLSMDTAVIVLVLNSLALVLGGIALGRGFLAATVASSLLYPVFLSLMQRIPGIGSMTDNDLLAALFGGGLMGIALGLVLRVGASTGGMDVVTLVLHKWLHIPVSALVYLTDIVVIGGQALFATPERILYGIVLLIVEAIALDKVMILGQAQIQVFVISKRHEEIRRQILLKIQAGATMVQIETGLTGQPQQGVLCVIPPRKLFALKELIDAVDPDAFLTITQVKEVRGQGFTSAKQNRLAQSGWADVWIQNKKEERSGKQYGL